MAANIVTKYSPIRHTQEAEVWDFPLLSSTLNLFCLVQSVLSCSLSAELLLHVASDRCSFVTQLFHSSTACSHCLFYTCHVCYILLQHLLHGTLEARGHTDLQLAIFFLSLALFIRLSTSAQHDAVSRYAPPTLSQ